MVDCYNREVQGLDDVEIWIHTCWGNPNMQRVMEDTSYKASFELYLNEMRGDVWTIETKDRNFTDIELFGQYKGQAAEEAVHRRGQPPHAAGRSRRGRRRLDPHGAAARRARAADRVERLRLRPAGRQPGNRVLQGQCDRAGLQHRSGGTRVEVQLRAGSRSDAADRHRAQGLNSGDSRLSQRQQEKGRKGGSIAVGGSSELCWRAALRAAAETRGRQIPSTL